MTKHPTPETSSHSTHPASGSAEKPAHSASGSAEKPAHSANSSAEKPAHSANSSAEKPAHSANSSAEKLAHSVNSSAEKPAHTAAQSSVVDHKAIAARAYQKYLDGGQQDGQEVENWLKAEQELKAEQKPTTPPIVDHDVRSDAPPIAEVSAYVSRQ